MNRLQMKLVIAEKPSVAQSLALCLGATKRQDGYLEGNEYQYLLAALYNAPGTISSYYSAKVNHDLYGSP